MGIFGKLLGWATWWDGASLTHRIGIRRNRRVGSDAAGNLYFEGKRDVYGRPRRYVLYKGANDASRVPPEWHAWLHHQIDDVPDKALPPVKPWIKAAKANPTGTPAAYRPAGSLEAGGRRAAATGDYEAWSPEQA
jgi:NADH:ubiquinone oxidoreductase subunit